MELFYCCFFFLMSADHDLTHISQSSSKVIFIQNSCEMVNEQVLLKLT